MYQLRISLFKMMAENWSNLKNIIDRSYRLDLSTHLLESRRCDQLTSIEISFRNKSEADSTACDKLNALITHIHNAPSFEKIFLIRVVITTANLEALHQAAPKLKDIKLDTVFVYGDDTNALMGYSPAEKMESFSMIYIKGRLYQKTTTMKNQ